MSRSTTCNFPREVIVGVNILDKVGEICTKQGFSRHSAGSLGTRDLSIAGVGVAKSAAKAGLRVDHIIVKESTEAVLNQIIEAIKKARPSIVLAVGVGRILIWASLPLRKRQFRS